MGTAASGSVVVELQIDPSLTVLVVATKADSDLSAAPCRGYLFGHRLSHSPEQGVAYAESGQAASRHGRRMLGIHEAAFGGGDIKRPEEAAVRLDGRVDQAFENSVNV